MGDKLSGCNCCDCFEAQKLFDYWDPVFEEFKVFWKSSKVDTITDRERVIKRTFNSSGTLIDSEILSTTDNTYPLEAVVTYGTGTEIEYGTYTTNTDTGFLLQSTSQTSEPGPGDTTIVYVTQIFKRTQVATTFTYITLVYYNPGDFPFTGINDQDGNPIIKTVRAVLGGQFKGLFHTGSKPTNFEEAQTYTDALPFGYVSGTTTEIKTWLPASGLLGKMVISLGGVTYVKPTTVPFIRIYMKEGSPYLGTPLDTYFYPFVEFSGSMQNQFVIKNIQSRRIGIALRDCLKRGFFKDGRTVRVEFLEIDEEGVLTETPFYDTTIKVKDAGLVRLTPALDPRPVRRFELIAESDLETVCLDFKEVFDGSDPPTMADNDSVEYDWGPTFLIGDHTLEMRSTGTTQATPAYDSEAPFDYIETGSGSNLSWTKRPQAVYDYYPSSLTDIPESWWVRVTISDLPYKPNQVVVGGLDHVEPSSTLKCPSRTCPTGLDGISPFVKETTVNGFSGTLTHRYTTYDNCEADGRYINLDEDNYYGYLNVGPAFIVKDLVIVYRAQYWNGVTGSFGRVTAEKSWGWRNGGVYLDEYNGTTPAQTYNDLKPGVSIYNAELSIDSKIDQAQVIYDLRECTPEEGSESEVVVAAEAIITVPQIAIHQHTFDTEVDYDQPSVSFLGSPSYRAWGESFGSFLGYFGFAIGKGPDSFDSTMDTLTGTTYQELTDTIFDGFPTPPAPPATITQGSATLFLQNPDDFKHFNEGGVPVSYGAAFVRALSKVNASGRYRYKYEKVIDRSTTDGGEVTLAEEDLTDEFDTSFSIDNSRSDLNNGAWICTGITCSSPETYLYSTSSFTYLGIRCQLSFTQELIPLSSISLVATFSEARV